MESRRASAAARNSRAYAHLARERAEREGDDAGDRNPALLSLTTKLFKESLGDQFDKGSTLTLTSEAFAATPMTDAWRAYMADYRREYAHAADQLRELNAVLAATVGDSPRLNAAADSLARALPLEGRPVGYFITHHIRHHLGDPKLAATVGSPAAWLNAYRAAAAVPDCGCPMVDEAWIESLP